jgi:hypothetical protein
MKIAGWGKGSVGFWLFLSLHAGAAQVRLESCESAVVQSFAWADLSVPVPPEISFADFKRQYPKVDGFPDLTNRQSVHGFFERYSQGEAFLSIGQRTFYITRSPRTLEAVIPNSTDRAQATATRILELPDFYAFEITRLSFIGEKMGEFNGRFPYDDGPNCWNFCQMYQGWSLDSMPLDFQNQYYWLEKNPFSTALGEYRPDMELRPGDIIDIQLFKNNKRVGDGHSMVNLNGALVAQKLNYKFETPYEITRLRPEIEKYRRIERLDGVYEGKVFVYRVKPFDEMWSEYKTKLPQNLVAITEKVMELEKIRRKFTMPPKMKGGNYEGDDSEERALEKAVLAELEPLVPAVQAVLERAEAGEADLKAEAFLWRHLFFRLKIAYRLKKKT